MGQLTVDRNAKMEVLTTETESKKRTGIAFPRYFTSRLEPGKTPYDDVQWETRGPDRRRQFAMPLFTLPRSFAAGRYQIQGRLGEGGQKHVLLARDVTPEATRAVIDRE